MSDLLSRQGDKETRRQGARPTASLSPCLLVSLSPCLLLFLAAGCGSKPSAPPLQTDRVYRSAYAGLRFTAPEGWMQRARGEVPSGKVVGERPLAEYKCVAGTSPGTLVVTVADVPEATPLQDYVKKHNFTGQEWRPTKKPV